MAEKWQLWMPFHIDRFRGSPAVQAMAPAARIGYLYLLATQWQSDDCTISSDPLELATQSGLGDDLWALHGPRILRQFCALENGRLSNDVCHREWRVAKERFERSCAASDEVRQKRSQAGKKGNLARWSAADRKPIAKSSQKSQNNENDAEKLDFKFCDNNQSQNIGFAMGIDSKIVANCDDIDRKPIANDRLTGTVTVTVTGTETYPPGSGKVDSVDCRILAESVGIFEMRQEADMHRCLAVFCRESRLPVAEAIQHMIGRWAEYQARQDLPWRYGSAHKFFMSGNWNRPETWAGGTNGNGSEGYYAKLKRDLGIEESGGIEGDSAEFDQHGDPPASEARRRHD